MWMTDIERNIQCLFFYIYFHIFVNAYIFWSENPVLLLALLRRFSELSLLACARWKFSVHEHVCRKFCKHYFFLLALLFRQLIWYCAHVPRSTFRAVAGALHTKYNVTYTHCPCSFRIDWRENFLLM